MTLIIAFAIWLALSVLLAFTIGRAIRQRDELHLTEADMIDPRITDLLESGCNRPCQPAARAWPASHHARAGNVVPIHAAGDKL